MVLLKQSLKNNYNDFYFYFKYLLNNTENKLYL